MSATLQPAPSQAPTTEPPAPAPSTIVDRLYRLSVEQYHAMAEAGILGARDRVVLLGGCSSPR